mmetsp:Transcript_11788/g.18913  ORF Transcript_11788/g.18913 Transcript_11788/m.18913 type:complete len:179 (-) Transcript_11788:1901-2437(-)
MVLYNIGVRLYKQNEWNKAVKWLKLSFEALQHESKNLKAEEKSIRIIKVIAACHVSEGKFSHGLSALELASRFKEVANDPDFLFLKIKMLAGLKRNTELKRCLKEVVGHNECSVKMCLAACEAATECSPALAKEFYNKLIERFPEDSTVYVQKFYFLIHQQMLDAAASLIKYGKFRTY